MPWDMAAGALIVIEAGGRFSAVDGSPFSIDGGQVLSSNGLVHESIVRPAERRHRSNSSPPKAFPFERGHGMRNALVTLHWLHGCHHPVPSRACAADRRRPGAGVLVAPLLAPALDLLHIVQPSVGLAMPTLVAAVAAGVVLAITWARYPRTSWLAASMLAALASVALRLAGAEVAPAFSLAGVVALGLGGAFASRSGEVEAWLELSPAAPDGTADVGLRPLSDRQLPPRAA